MKTKKLLSILLTGVTAIGLMTGCGNSDAGKQTSANNSKTTNGANASGNTNPATHDVDTEKSGTENNTAADNTQSTGGKTLVVYYSATGNTKDVAETIANVTGADLFEIEPKEPYTDEDLGL